MIYWDESESGSRKKQKTEKEITKDGIKNTLAFIKNGHLPDWNYETRNKTSLPNEYYPLHVAMQIAIRAVDAMDDEFFKAIDREYTEIQQKVRN